jgi:hypothetical protein
MVDVNFNPFPTTVVASESYHSPHAYKPPTSGWVYNRNKSGGILQ